jgi:hypothetical protein
MKNLNNFLHTVLDSTYKKEIKFEIIEIQEEIKTET